MALHGMKNNRTVGYLKEGIVFNTSHSPRDYLQLSKYKIVLRCTCQDVKIQELSCIAK